MATRYIRYLENGEWKYASIKDVGDLLLLDTVDKSSIVNAINEILAEINGTEPTSINSRLATAESDLDKATQTLTDMLHIKYVDGKLVYYPNNDETFEQKYVAVKEDLNAKVDIETYSQDYESTTQALADKAEKLALEAVEKKVDAIFDVKITSSAGNVFRGQEQTLMTARLFQAGIEVDTVEPYQYTYRWSKKDKNGNVVSDWDGKRFKLGKSILVDNSDIEQKCTFNLEII